MPSRSISVDAARAVDAPQARREVEAQPAAERFAPEALALRVRLERPPRLAVAKTDVVAEPDVLAGVDAALRAVAREGARCWRRWSAAVRRQRRVASSVQGVRERRFGGGELIGPGVPTRHWTAQRDANLSWASDEDNMGSTEPLALLAPVASTY